MKKSGRLIVFFIPPKKDINGGIMSIFSICKTSREFKDIHGAEVYICTFPGYDSYKKNDLFENDETVYSFDEIVGLGKPAYLQLHVPEYASSIVFEGLKPYEDYLRAIPELSVNILNQNILQMRPPLEVADWFLLTPEVTQTTAHNRYTTQELADRYNLPAHLFSTCGDQSEFKLTPYESKQKIMLLSPDKARGRGAAIKKLSESLSDYQLVTVEHMPYEKYKTFVGQAKFTVTFGEGFDGYYAQAFLSGGIAFAVYNEDFFPDNDFAKFRNTFASQPEMAAKLPGRIAELDNKSVYEKVVQQNREKINRLYSYENYRENIKNFYLKRFDYLPSKGSAERLMGGLLSVLKDRDNSIDQLKEDVARLHGEARNRDLVINDLADKINAITSSQSWRITRPLRQASRAVKSTKGRRRKSS